ncbi:MAG: hypothetical protein KJ607_02670 [Bacteroidetes bacterium]|nr:hypothetical protein [Bacteroidota bacterium]
MNDTKMNFLNKNILLIARILLMIFVMTQALIYPAYSQLWYLTRGGAGNGSGGDEGWGVDVDDEGNVYWATCEKPAGTGCYNIKIRKPYLEQIVG